MVLQQHAAHDHGRQHEPGDVARASRGAKGLALTSGGPQPEKGPETLYVVREVGPKRAWFAEAFRPSSAWMPVMVRPAMMERNTAEPAKRA